MEQFFEVSIADNRRWHLRMSVDEAPLSIWAATRICEAISIPFNVDVAGLCVDYNISSFAVPVVSRRVADFLASVAVMDIQRIPAIIAGERGNWEVLNIISCIDCIDHQRSRIQYYPSDDPHKPGKPRGVLQLVLNSNRILGHNVLRPKDWEISVIVSEQVKRGLEDMNATGIEYSPVSGR